jgi:hypothetical protein
VFSSHLPCSVNGFLHQQQLFTISQSAAPTGWCTEWRARSGAQLGAGRREIGPFEHTCAFVVGVLVGPLVGAGRGWSPAPPNKDLWDARTTSAVFFFRWAHD